MSRPGNHSSCPRTSLRHQRRPTKMGESPRPSALRMNRAGSNPLRPPRLALVAILGALMLVPQTEAQTCREPGMNGQCSEFGAIVMDNQHSVRGEPVDVTATIVLNTVYEEQAARWILFSARSVEEDGGKSPVTIELVRLVSDHGDIVASQVEHPAPNELDVWVDTADVPVGTPLSFGLSVGSTERGAFRLEALVLAFDRAYTP